MSPQPLAETSRASIALGVVVMVLMVTGGVFLFKAVNPSDERAEPARTNPARAQAVLRQQRMLEEIDEQWGWEVN